MGAWASRPCGHWFSSRRGSSVVLYSAISWTRSGCLHLFWGEVRGRRCRATWRGGDDRPRSSGAGRAMHCPRRKIQKATICAKRTRGPSGASRRHHGRTPHVLTGAVAPWGRWHSRQQKTGGDLHPRRFPQSSMKRFVYARLAVFRRMRQRTNALPRPMSAQVEGSGMAATVPLITRSFPSWKLFKNHVPAPFVAPQETILMPITLPDETF